jgi:hypothetical protein
MTCLHRGSAFSIGNSVGVVNRRPMVFGVTPRVILLGSATDSLRQDIWKGKD